MGTLARQCCRPRVANLPNVLRQLDLDLLPNHANGILFYPQLRIVDPGSIFQRKSPMVPGTGNGAAGDVSFRQGCTLVRAKVIYGIVLSFVQKDGYDALADRKGLTATFFNLTNLCDSDIRWRRWLAREKR